MMDIFNLHKCHLNWKILRLHFWGLADIVLAGLQGVSVLAYLDDIIIYNSNMQKHFDSLK